MLIGLAVQRYNGWQRQVARAAAIHIPNGRPARPPAAYWGTYSKKDGYYNYINIGVYTDVMKAEQNRQTKAHLARGEGYMLASTWLQCVAPYGPNHSPGGDGTQADTGVKWWLGFLHDTCGPYRPR